MVIILPHPTVYVNKVVADPSKIYLPITIDHGRSNPESQPDASTCSLEWAEPEFAPVEGDEIWIEANLVTSDAPPTYDSTTVVYDDPLATYGGGWRAISTRFIGTVEDKDTTEYIGIPNGVKITAVSRMARLGRYNVFLDRPAESDVARVQAIVDAVGVPINILGTPSSELIPAVIDTDAMNALHDICATTGGLVWHDTRGALYYGTGDHRVLGLPIAVLPSHEIIDGIEWQSTLGDIINRISVGYGLNQEKVTITDDGSIALYDIRDKDIKTLWPDNGAANQFGALVLARRSYPFARITDVVIDSYTTEAEHVLNEALVLGVSEAILMPIPADPGPVGILAEWIVEGWKEEWPNYNQVTLQFAVTDRARFAKTILRIWSVADDFTWQQELDRGTWLDVLILQPEEIP